jgi:hypothetical protein
MSQSKPEVFVVRVILTGLAGFFNFIGFILVMFFAFGGIYTGYSWNGYYCLTCSYLYGWSKIFILLLGLLFFVGLAIAIILVLSNFITQIPQKVVKPLHIGGLIGAGVTFVLTGITVAVFALQVAAEVGTDWWLETGFYGAIIGSLLAIIFYLLALILKPTGPAKA